MSSRTGMTGGGGGVTHAHYARMIWNIFHQHRGERNLGTGIVFVTPVQFTDTVTIDRLGVVIAAAAGNIRLGIYEDNGDTPDGGDLLAETASIAAVANKNEVVMVPATLQLYGLYWLAFQYDNAGCSQAENSYCCRGGTLNVRQYNLVFAAFTDPCPATIASDYSQIMYARVVP